MECNVGKTDRALRIVAGIVIIAVGVFEHSWLGVIGVVPLATAFLRFCTAYTMLGFSTNKCCGSCKSDKP